MHKIKKTTGIIVGILLPMGILCLFALGSLVLALFGGRVYKSIQTSGEKDLETTIAVNYLRTKLSQNNQEGATGLSTVDGVQLLTLRTTTEDGIYKTCIFVHEGRLMEAFIAENKTLDVSDAVAIAQLSSCEFSISKNNLFLANIVAKNGAHTRVAFALAPGGAS